MRSFLYLYGNVRNRMGGIVVSYTATQDQIARLYEVPFYKEEQGRYENKSRMKEQAVAIWGYEAFLKEMTLVALAKTVEDSIVDLKAELSINVDIWGEPFSYNVRYLEDVRVVRNLNNVIKHHRGRISHAIPMVGRHLADNGFPDGIHIKDAKIDYLECARRTYIFLVDLVMKTSGIKLAAKGVPQTEDEFIESFIPENLRTKKSD